LAALQTADVDVTVKQWGREEFDEVESSGVVVFM
jgi:hypothetical protein